MVTVALLFRPSTTPPGKQFLSAEVVDQRKAVYREQHLALHRDADKPSK